MFERLDQKIPTMYQKGSNSVRTYGAPLTSYTVSLDQDSKRISPRQRYLRSLVGVLVFIYIISSSVGWPVLAPLMLFMPLLVQHYARTELTMWDEVLRDHVTQIAQIEHSTRRFMGSTKFGFLTIVMGILVRALPLRWCDEVCAISAKTGVSIGCLGFLQIVYEFAAACTSFVITDGDSPPLHIRTMDWRMPFDLGPLTIQIDFVRDGRVVFSGTTFAGYTGILTGMRHPNLEVEGFSIAVNFRSKTSSSTDSEYGLGWALLRGGSLVGQQVRGVLEAGPAQFQQLVHQLETCPLLAPSYLTIAPDSHHNEPVVLTRGRHTSIKMRSGNDLVQANMDAHKVVDVMNSVQRINYAQRFMDVFKREQLKSKLERSELSAWDRLWELISKGPLTHSSTIYANVMCPGYGWYETRINRTYAGKFEKTLDEIRSTVLTHDA